MSSSHGRDDGCCRSFDDDASSYVRFGRGVNRCLTFFIISIIKPHHINRSTFTKPSITRSGFTKPSINRWQFGERYDVIIDFNRLSKGSALEINELSVLFPQKSQNFRLRRAKNQSIAIRITITSIDYDYDTITSIDAKPMTSKHIEDCEKL